MAQTSSSTQSYQGIGVVSFLAAVSTATLVFAAQLCLFALLRSRLVRVYQPKTYLAPEHERAEPPPRNFAGLIKTLAQYRDRKILESCGLDAFFFLRYLRTMFVIFLPICLIVSPILVPLNYIGGRGQNLQASHNASAPSQVTGLDTLSWANVSPSQTQRYSVHLIMSILVVAWVCAVFCFEMKTYIQIRQEHITSARHRSTVSSNTVLVSSIPQKWLNKEALASLFDIFPGGVHSVWLNYDLTALLQKISRRTQVQIMLEVAETKLIRAANKAHIRSCRKHVGSDANVEDSCRKMVQPMDPFGDCHTTPKFGESDSQYSANIYQRNIGASERNHTTALGARVAHLGDTAKEVIIQGGYELENTMETTNGFKSLESYGAQSARREDEGIGWQDVSDKAGVSPARKIVQSPATAIGDCTHTPFPFAYNAKHSKNNDGPAKWEKFLTTRDRPSHRPSPLGLMWPGLPLFNKKVDTIYWCRENLARLNVEIERDQQCFESFPLLSSAFIQFNNQIAAHMACQSVIHHLPKAMSPRMTEISPLDVIWENMALKWWQQWLRTVIVTVIICGMIPVWAVPVAWTAAVSQLEDLIQSSRRFRALKKNHIAGTVVKAVAGVLPATVLSILLVILPTVLDFLASFSGAKTGAQKTKFVQNFYFIFLFIQIFVVVSIASIFAVSWDDLIENVAKLKSVNDVLILLAINIPKAANYFFSYMILQAMSTSSGTLLQTGILLQWYVIARTCDNTAREKWSRNTTLSTIRWETFFPVYTTFACVGIIYSIIAPLISLFTIITFGLLWLTHRYTTLYVIRFETDTGGVLYPQAINQTFTGLYFMEACVAGLFFIVVDDKGARPCATHGMIMVIVLLLTALYQSILNYVFSPLFRYLPVTLEDEGMTRDRIFQQHLQRDCHWAYSAIAGRRKAEGTARTPRHADLDIELYNLRDAEGANSHTRHHRMDREAQLAMGQALYGDIYKLNCGDTLTKQTFQHAGLCVRRPTVWIPKDDLGVSDDEIYQTKAYSDHILISNAGAGIDSQLRVVYSTNPPDLS